MRGRGQPEAQLGGRQRAPPSGQPCPFCPRAITPTLAFMAQGFPSVSTLGGHPLTSHSLIYRHLDPRLGRIHGCPSFPFLGATLCDLLLLFMFLLLTDS